jgi:hypothetical protein
VRASVTGSTSELPSGAAQMIGVWGLARLGEGGRTLLRALVASTLLGPSSSAVAQVSLEWDAPAGCPTRDAVVAQVTRLLAGSTVARSAAPVSARATVRTLEAGFVLELSTDVSGVHGERTLQAPSCAELAAASAVIVALLVDPEVVSATPAAPPASGGAPAAGASRSAPTTTRGGDDVAPERSADDTDAADDAADDDAQERAEEDPDAPGDVAGEDEQDAPIEPGDEPDTGRSVTQLFVRPELVLDVGALPRASAGPGLALGVRLGPLALEASGRYAPEQRVRRDGRTLARLEHAAAALALCYALPPLAWLSPCGRVEYGRLWGRGVTLRAPSPGEGALVVAELSLRAALSLGQTLALTAESGLGLPLVAPLFTVGGVGAIHEPAALLVRLRAGVELRLP